MLTNILLWLTAGVIGAHIVQFYIGQANLDAVYFHKNPLKPLQPRQVMLLTALGPVSLWISLGGLSAAVNEICFGNREKELPEDKYLGYAGPLGLIYVLARLATQVVRDSRK